MAKFKGTDGDDTLTGTDNNDTIRGLLGDDILFGEDGHDELIGASGEDRLFGGLGDDSLTGGLGVDLFRGDSGDDTISGGAGGLDEVHFHGSKDPVTVDLQKGFATGEGKDVLIGLEDVQGSKFNDKIFGSQVANELEGLPGDDTLEGRAGNDKLDGDAGRDTLKGGRGNDTFEYQEVDSSTGHKNRDVILDFTPGQDKIDIAPFNGTDTATFIGTAEFSATGKFEVRFASGLVQLDTNGDGVEDHEIEVQGVPFLSASDFIL